jgi:hypothetical protein
MFLRRYNQLVSTVNHVSLLAAIETTNVMQAFNFSFNWVLYALLNVQFRRTLEYVVCFRPCRPSSSARRCAADDADQNRGPVRRRDNATNADVWGSDTRRNSVHTTLQRLVSVNSCCEVQPPSVNLTQQRRQSSAVERGISRDTAV